MGSMTSAPTLTSAHVTPPDAQLTVSERPSWIRPAVALLLAVTAVLYLWNLSTSGYGNSFYAMAVQAGTQSWEAWFFGSLDPGNIITVDKPPASLWLMGLSGRIFGFSSWSMLVPNALAGVASVGLVYLALRRTNGPVAGLLGGSVVALTPVAALMFRFNNPDAVLVLLMVAGAYCVIRALDKASTMWLLLAGVAIGFGFLDKMLQAFLVLPAFVLAYLVAAPTSLGKRIAQLFGAAAAVAVSAGWWVAAVSLWPAANRPYIGGSTNNSALELALGYNGLGRILGGDGNPGGTGGTGGQGGGPGGGMFGGATGLGRMFSSTFGSEISWLLPTALIALVAGLWFTRHAPRTDRTRAALLLWGGWTVVTAGVFSFMSGIIHPYYTVALAPGIAGIIGIAGVELWRGRRNFTARVALALMVASAAVWGFILLTRNDSWQPWVRYAALVFAAAAVGAILLGADRLRGAAPAVAVVALIGGLLAPAAFTVATAATAHSGAIPTSGPASSGRFGGGGPGGEGQSNSELEALVNASTTKWAAAASGYQEAAGLALPTGKSVMVIGGFSGSDPAPTLAQFQQYVANGDIHYYIGGGMGGGMGGRGGSSEIASWVQTNFAATTVGSATIYDLTKTN
jgi:4-amino-4-deoxy-L-arabinose transferase-like glycosyltransferase